MAKGNTMFYRALLLTGANLVLRAVGVGFQVYLSGQMGAAGIGLLQLTMSVCTLAMTAAMAGIRTGTMYLTAEALGKGRHGELGRVLSACFRYSFVVSVAVAIAVYALAPWLAGYWIGDGRVVLALRLFAAFLPVVCLVGVLTGYYTAAGRVRALVVVELAEQAVSMTVGVLLLTLWADGDPGRACASVIGGSSVASVLTLLCLWCFRGRGSVGEHQRSPVMPRLLKVAVPLAFADVLRMGISTAENLIVPRRLARYGDMASAMADYGRVCGMVFPVVMFPACILWSVAELLIPELSRCAAGQRQRRIGYLTARSLRVALLYGLMAGGVLFVCAEGLGVLLYDSVEVGRLLRSYAILVPMLYADSITDAVIKGMGQQVACVRYNTITSFLDVVILWVLLPRVGLGGYYFSFVVTHGLNFYLSLRRLRKVTGFAPALGIPLKAVIAAVLAAGITSLLPRSAEAGALIFTGGVFLLVFTLSAVLLGAVRREDFHWLRSLAGGADKR